MADPLIVLLSGPFKVGKSTLTSVLVESFGFQRISSSGYLRSLIPDLDESNLAKTRLRLQEKGDQLDLETDYRWVVDPVTTSTIDQSPQVNGWLIDAVRKQRQVEHFRERFGSAVVHIHLIAPEEVTQARSGLSQDAYQSAIAHPNEVSARNLGEIADRVFDTTAQTPHQIATRIAGREITP